MAFWDFYKDNIVEKIVEYICDEIREVYEDKIDYSKMINTVLMSVYQISNIPFVIIIDEWDCVIRNSDNEEIVHKYLQFLHSLFKSEESKSFLALAYITGILPIKKVKDESALNNFITMNYAGLKDDIMTMLAGGKAIVDPRTFQNDLSEIHSKDDAQGKESKHHTCVIEEISDEVKNCKRKNIIGNNVECSILWM